MRVAILNNDGLLALMDNEAEGSLFFYNEKIHRYLKGNASTFEFTCTAKHPDAQYIVVGNKIAFVYDGVQYYMNIVSAKQDEYEIDVMCYTGTLGFVNGVIGAFSRASGTITEYLSDALKDAIDVEFGINELGSKRLSNKWIDGQDETVLARMFSIASEFGAEIEFVTELNDNFTLKRNVINIYHEHDDEHQGIGTDRNDTYLRYGYNVQGITREMDVTDMFTAIKPVGKDGLLMGVFGFKEYDKDGNVAYFKQDRVDIYGQEYDPDKGSIIFAPIARDRFPSHLTGNGYIVRLWNYETDNQELLQAQALAYLKRRCVPDAVYAIDGYIDGSIGDTFTVIDEEFNPPLYLQTRITEMEIYPSDTSNNKTVFSNTLELVAGLNESTYRYSIKIDSKKHAAKRDPLYGIELIATVTYGSRELTQEDLDYSGLTVVWLINGEEIEERGISVFIPMERAREYQLVGYVLSDGAKVKARLEEV